MLEIALKRSTDGAKVYKASPRRLPLVPAKNWRNQLSEKRGFSFTDPYFALSCNQVEKREKNKRKKGSDNEESGEEDDDEMQTSQSQRRTTKT